MNKHVGDIVPDVEVFYRITVYCTCGQRFRATGTNKERTGQEAKRLRQAHILLQNVSTQRIAALV